MKALKLLLIFILLIGGILLAFTWNSLFPSSDEEDFAEFNEININQKCSDIRKAWDNERFWNDSLYKSQKVDTEQCKNLKRVNKEGYDAISNSIKEKATNKACDSYIEILKDASIYNDSLLTEQYKGVQCVKESEEMGDDDRIIKIEKINSLYKTAIAFVNSSHYLKPHFNTKRKSWNSFEKEQANLLSKANNIKADEMYSFIANVPGLDEKLDENYLKNVTDPQRSKFYRYLSKSIINYYSRYSSLTSSELYTFKKVLERFSSESDGFEEMADLYLKFGGV